MPYIQQVAVGRLPELNVYGTDYPTRDGTPVYIYVLYVECHVVFKHGLMMPSRVIELYK